MPSYAGRVATTDDDLTVYNPIGSTLYGVCASLASSADKEVSLSEYNQLLSGTTVHVKFTNTNTATGTIYLKVGSTDKKSILISNGVSPGNTEATSWAAGSVVSFTYDGTSDVWRMNDYGANAAIVTQLSGSVSAEATTRASEDAGIRAQIAPDYDSTAPYRKNQLVMQSKVLYRAKQDITTAEEWTAAHWEETTVAAEREYKIVVSNKEIGVKSTASTDIGESTGITSATVDVTEYEKYLQVSAVFVYNQTQWDITGGASGINPETYGITVEGTAADGDTITVTYTAGTFPFKKDTNNTYPEYPYRADVAIDNVKSTMIADVIFALSDAISGMFAPIVESHDGGIYVYATNIPDSSVTIPTIVLWG